MSEISQEITSETPVKTADLDKPTVICPPLFSGIGVGSFFEQTVEIRYALLQRRRALRSPSETRKLCYRKEDRAMRLVYETLKAEPG